METVKSQRRERTTFATFGKEKSHATGCCTAQGLLERAAIIEARSGGDGGSHY
jgi:hypothetical protein